MFVSIAIGNMASWPQLLTSSFSLLIFEEGQLFSSRDGSHSINPFSSSNESLLWQPPCPYSLKPLQLDRSVGVDLVSRLPFPPCLQMLTVLYLHLTLTSVENSDFYDDRSHPSLIPVGIIGLMEGGALKQG